MLERNSIDLLLLAATIAAMLVALVALLVSLAALNRLRSQSPPSGARQARFNWRMLAAGAVVSLIAVAAVWLFTPTRYKASTVVQVESPFPRSPTQLTEPPVPHEQMERYLEDQVVLLRDDSVLREALMDAQVRSTEWYRQHKDKMVSLDKLDKPILLDVLRDGLSVTRLPPSAYLQVSFRAANPKDAANIVNTVIDKYLYKIQEMSQLQYQGELDDVRRREKALYDRLQAILNDKMKFIAQSLGAPGVTEGLNLVGERLKTLAAAMTKVEEEKLAAKSVYDNIAGMDRHRIGLTPEIKQLIQDDPRIAALQDRKLELELELQGAPATAPAEDVSNRWRAQIEFIERKLSELTAARENELYDYQLHSAQTTFVNKTAEELKLRESMLELEARQRDLDQGMARYRNLEEQQAILTKELDLVRQYSNQLELVIKDRGMVRVHKIGTATPPTEPIESFKPC